MFTFRKAWIAVFGVALLAVIGLGYGALVEFDSRGDDMFAGWQIIAWSLMVLVLVAGAAIVLGIMHLAVTCYRRRQKTLPKEEKDLNREYTRWLADKRLHVMSVETREDGVAFMLWIGAVGFERRLFVPRAHPDFDAFATVVPRASVTLTYSETPIPCVDERNPAAHLLYGDGCIDLDEPCPRCGNSRQIDCEIPGGDSGVTVMGASILAGSQWVKVSCPLCGGSIRLTRA